MIQCTLRIAPQALFLAFAAGPAAAQIVPVVPAPPALPELVRITIVGGEVVGTPPIVGTTDTLANAPMQVVGGMPKGTGYLAFKYGKDARGITNYWAKTRGPAANTYRGAGRRPHRHRLLAGRDRWSDRIRRLPASLAATHERVRLATLLENAEIRPIVREGSALALALALLA